MLQRQHDKAIGKADTDINPKAFELAVKLGLGKAYIQEFYEIYKQEKNAAWTEYAEQRLQKEIKELERLIVLKKETEEILTYFYDQLDDLKKRKAAIVEALKPKGA